MTFIAPKPPTVTTLSHGMHIDATTGHMWLFFLGRCHKAFDIYHAPGSSDTRYGRIFHIMGFL